MKSFDQDPAGAVLSFAAIHRAGDRASADRQAWERVNLKPGPFGDFGTPPYVWMSTAMTRGVLEKILSIGRNEKVVRRTLARVFFTLERERLIEPFFGDDNPHSLYRSITELGAELVAEDAHLEFVLGLPHVVQRWQDSVACIFNNGGIGTGFFVSSRSIVTARHVLEELGTYSITDKSDRPLAVESVRYPTHGDIDLALVTLRDESADVAPMRIARSCEVLDEVVVFGYPPVPHTDDAYLLVNRGEVSAVVNLRSGVQAVLVTCLLRGGYSGGPILNRRGQVIGVVSKNLFNMVSPGEASVNESLGFAAAVPSEWIADLITGKI